MNNQTAISIIDSADANSSNHRIDHRHKHRRHHHQHHNLPRRIKRRSKISNKTLGKFLGFTFLLLILVAMFIAIRGRHNEMMYVALTFTIFSIALFSYGYWSAVNRGDGIWQYIGPTNLQHQQMSNPNYHFDPIHPEQQQQQLSSSMKNNPNIRSYMVAPPKMGGQTSGNYSLNENADFTEVILPDRKSKSNHSISQSN
ncbi:hypothetical protein DERP_014678 [Dermatophagoides pteronyssinus]|uniref:Uncharacterized protein n=1 Tax=Dermatophagoides pteronyssinus TaxID=6956 RepID=A0ABQ8JRK4_DERPT|nr:hypothetical protein DERP_014678 [Dermatophagoides pteronyssinus]